MITKKTTLALITAVIFSAPAFSADNNAGSNGSLGTTSEGSLTIDLNIKRYDGTDGAVLIRDLDNISLGIFQAADMGDVSNFCIFASGYSSDTTYDALSVQIGGGDGTGDFELAGTNQNTDVVPYKVFYKSGLDASDEDSEAAAGTSHSFANLDSVAIADDLTCSENNASVYVYVSAVDASQVQEDTYTGQLTLTVSAN